MVAANCSSSTTSPGRSDAADVEMSPTSCAARVDGGGSWAAAFAFAFAKPAGAGLAALPYGSGAMVAHHFWWLESRRGGAKQSSRWQVVGDRQHDAPNRGVLLAG